MKCYENLQPGDRVEWRGISREYSGKVLRLDPRGYIVQVDGSDKVVLLSKKQPKKK